jgi:hypothetical protein
MQEVGLRVAASERHVQCLFDQVSIIGFCHRPADDEARE